MAQRPSIITVLKSGMALAAAPYIRETLNWIMASWANLKAEDGLEIVRHESDHPSLRLKLKAGKGISLKRAASGWMEISAEKSDGEGDEKSGGDKSQGTGANTSGGGSGSGSGGASGGGGGSGGGSGTGGSGGASGGGGGSPASGLDGSTNCNNWSGGGDGNGWGSDSGNNGDNCSTVNGW